MIYLTLENSDFEKKEKHQITKSNSISIIRTRVFFFSFDYLMGEMEDKT